MSKIAIEVAAEVKQAVQGINEVSGKLTGLQKTASSGLPTLKGMLAADVIKEAASVVTGAIGDAFGAVQEQARLAAQTGAVLKSTGNQAGITAQGISDLADAIEAKSTLDAEAVQKGQNLLLTFTNIKNAAGAGNDVFNQTTQIMADMATAMGSDPSASAIQLGKALNDPIKGISALSKVGVSFTAEQKKTIETLQKSGDTMGAQKVILAELSKEFGGSAEAAGKTFPGAMKHLKDTFDGFLESGVKALLPYLQQLATWAAANLPAALDALGGAISRVASFLAPLGDVAKAVFGFLASNPDVVRNVAIALGVLAGAVGVVTAAQWLWNAALTANPVGLVVVAVVAAVALIVGGITYLWNHVQGFRDGVQAVGAVLMAIWRAVSTAVLAVFRGLQAGVQALGRVFSSAASALRSAWQAAANAVRSAIDGLRNGISGAISYVGGIGSRIRSAVTGAVSGAASWLQDAGRRVVEGLINGVGGAIGWLKDQAMRLGGAVIDTVKNVFGIKSPSRVMRDIGLNLTSSLADQLGRGTSAVGRASALVGAAVLDGVGNLTPSLAITPRLGALQAAGAMTPSSRWAGGPVQVTVNVPPTANKADVGREVAAALRAYQRQGGVL